MFYCAVIYVLGDVRPLYIYWQPTIKETLNQLLLPESCMARNMNTTQPTFSIDIILVLVIHRGFKGFFDNVLIDK